MKGDFSRLTFNASKHFRRVLMQQGRVQLDADWNEQTAILLHYMETLAKDLIGEHGGPKNHAGFQITPIDNSNDNFRIGHGRYYVDGILVELETAPVSIQMLEEKNQLKASPLTIDNIELKEGQYLEIFAENNPSETTLVKIKTIDSSELATLETDVLLDDAPLKARHGITYTTQADYPIAESGELKNNIYLVYLDVWEQHITCLEDDSIREVALAGPDTATRAKTVWQVKVADAKKEKLQQVIKEQTTGSPNLVHDWFYDSSNSFWQDWKNQWQPSNRGLLKARAKQDPKNNNDPCVISAEASYRSTENQLYRVEIHAAGKAKEATFKWSRDNGSVVTGAKLMGTDLTVDNPRGFAVGLWVELTNGNQELRGERGTLVQIKNIDGEVLSLDAVTTPSAIVALPSDEIWPTKARLWESNEIIIKENDKEWAALADGIQIQFQPLNKDAENRYQTGDYWLIPARVATGDVEWPGAVGKPEALPPFGIKHHYAPLAIITVAEQGVTLAAELRQHIDLAINSCPQPAIIKSMEASPKKS